MSISDWIQLGEWVSGIIFGAVVALFGFIWWVRREALKRIDEAETTFAATLGRQDLDIIKLREDHGAEIKKISTDFTEFRVDISGKLFTRQDADVLRRDMTAMIEPVKAQVGLVQSSLDREMGELKGRMDALLGLLKDK